MDRIDWEKQYQEQCYMPVAKEYLETFLDGVTENAKKINKELNGQVDAFLQSLCMLQENGKLGQISTISISFPYTSLVCNSPCLLFEVYPEYPFMDDRIVSREFPVSWLFPEWEAFLLRLCNEAGDKGMGSVIRMPYLRAKSWGSARVILKIVSTIVKYHLYGLEEMNACRQLQKTSHFTVYFGEYMDWQRVILEEKEEVDIFFCEENTNLCFCRFNEKFYEGKTFENLNMDDCRFIDCHFTQCSFSESSFRDSRFLGCTFTDCRFEKVKLGGARFDGCKFQMVIMKNIETNSFSEDDSATMGMQGMTEFIGCSFENIKMVQCDYSTSYYRDCRIRNEELEDNVLPDSFYDCLSE